MANRVKADPAQTAGGIITEAAGNQGVAEFVDCYGHYQGKSHQHCQACETDRIVLQQVEGAKQHVLRWPTRFAGVAVMASVHAGWGPLRLNPNPPKDVLGDSP